MVQIKKEEASPVHTVAPSSQQFGITIWPFNEEGPEWQTAGFYQFVRPRLPDPGAYWQPLHSDLVRDFEYISIAPLD